MINSIAAKQKDNLYEIHFWVKYHDDVEEQEYWCVDEGRSVGAIPNIEAGEIVIDVNHDSKNDTWNQYDKGAASKVISLLDCEEYVIEKRYVKKDGVLSNEIEKTGVPLDVFKNTMIASRRKV